MVRRPTALAAVLLAGLAVAPGARAAWSVPQSVSAPANEVTPGVLVADPSGRVLATWMPLTYSGGHFTGTSGRAATRAPTAAAFDPPGSAPLLGSGPVLYAQTRAVGLSVRSRGWNRCGEAVDLRLHYGRSTGAFDAPTTIAAYRGPAGDGAPAIAANADGRIAAVWTASAADCTRGIVQFAERRSGGTGAFTAAGTLRGAGMSGTPTVSIGPRGDVVVAWARRLGEGRTRIEARFRRAGGSWGPLQALGDGTVAGALVTGVLTNGRAYVAWQRSAIDVDRGLTAGTWYAVQPSGARAFRAALRLEEVRTGVSYVHLRPILSVAGNSALIGWTGRHGSLWRVRVADSLSSGGFGPPQTVSSPDRSALLGDLALAAGGAAAVAVGPLDTEELPAAVAAAVRVAGGAFGAPETVTGDGPIRSLPLLALDPRTSQPTVVWTENLAAPSHNAANLDVRLRASSRVGP